LIRSVSCRLERLEARAAAKSNTSEPLTIAVVDSQGIVMSKLEWKDGEAVWTHPEDHEPASEICFPRRSGSGGPR
jgi:hypothetical protein